MYRSFLLNLSSCFWILNSVVDCGIQKLQDQVQCTNLWIPTTQYSDVNMCWTDIQKYTCQSCHDPKSRNFTTGHHCQIDEKKIGDLDCQGGYLLTTPSQDEEAYSCFNMIAGPSTTCGPVNVVYTSFVDPTTKIPKTNEDDGRLKKSDLIGLMTCDKCALSE